MKFQSPRGTEDVLPSEAYRWQHLERVFKGLAGVYGYQEIRTPTFEETNLFVRSVGETSDIVTKEMYEFKDKGDRSMTLKPEGTAGAMRALIEHNLCPPGHVSRLFYVTPIFRYERPQKGRYREAHQVGLELVGSASPEADAEIIEITSRFYERLGFENAVVSLNSIGREDCREKFKEEILRMMSSFLQDQDSEVQARVEKNPLRLLDSKDPAIQAALTELKPVTDFLGEASRANFERLQQRLSDRRVKFQLVPSIVRGLDYYTDTVFEVVSDQLGAQNSLCGGGRYDNLLQELGGASTPSVGVGMGIERALIALEELQVKIAESRPMFFGVVASPDARVPLERLADQLRDRDLGVVFDLGDRNLKAQLKQAARSKARYALIVGEDELAKNVVTLRNMDTSSQEVIGFDDLVLRAGELG